MIKIMLLVLLVFLIVFMLLMLYAKFEDWRNRDRRRVKMDIRNDWYEGMFKIDGR